MKTSSGSEGLNPYLTTSYQDGDYGKYEAKASPFTVVANDKICALALFTPIAPSGATEIQIYNRVDSKLDL